MEYQLKKSLLPQKDSYSVVERIFATRGVDPQDIEHYLHTTDDDILDPELIDNIQDGAKMLAKHIALNDDILVQVDSDCDGFTSSAFLINYLNCLFPGYVQHKVHYRIHPGKQHGITPDMIPWILEKGYKLVVAPDSSSNDYDQHRILKENGIDVLVIDHHEAEKVSENACIINNQLCDYPTKSLSGVGMVYKFCCYFDKMVDADYADNFLDLTALGLVGDMMDIRDFETRHLILKGLKRIRNPYFKEMCKVQDYSITRAGGLCPFALSFYIVPQINGTIRVGTLEEKTLLFEAMLDYRAYEQIPSTKRGSKGQLETRVTQACRNCTNLKRNQDKSVNENIEIIEKIIQDKHLDDNKIIAVKLGTEYNTDPNLTGLIANKLMAQYQHPFLLLKEYEEEGKVVWRGSGRGYETSTFNDLRSFIRESGYASLAEGHANAFGVAFDDDKFTQFIDYSNKELATCNFTPCTKVDFIWGQNEFDSRDILDIAAIGPIWGQELSEPVVAIENIRVTPNNLSLMGKGGRCPTFKITLPNGVSVIKFKVTDEEYDQLIPEFDSGSVNINIIGKCAINEWNGVVTPQIKVDDYEIVGETKYYF